MIRTSILLSGLLVAFAMTTTSVEAARYGSCNNRVAYRPVRVYVPAVAYVPTYRPVPVVSYRPAPVYAAPVYVAPRVYTPSIYAPRVTIGVGVGVGTPGFGYGYPRYGRFPF